MGRMGGVIAPGSIKPLRPRTQFIDFLLEESRAERKEGGLIKARAGWLTGYFVLRSSFLSFPPPLHYSSSVLFFGL